MRSRIHNAVAIGCALAALGLLFVAARVYARGEAWTDGAA